MKARNKTTVTHDYQATQLPASHVDYLLEIFDMKMKAATSIGLKSATFSTDDIAIAEAWGVKGYELKIERFTENNQHLWKGCFYSVTHPKQTLQVLGGLE